jgi:uncharacterized protein (TIGR02646 family)
MLLIQKTFPPQNLINFNTPRRTTASNPTYQELGADVTLFKEVKAYLETEQRGLCCYCMQRVTADNCNVEHFLSQSMFPEYQTDYYNLYLACRYSHGKAPKNQYCDIRKGNELIAKLLGFRLANGKLCQDLFQYDENDGSILPTTDKSRDLLQIRKEVDLAIETLNLNAIELKEARRKFIANIKPTIDSSNRIKLEAMKTDYETTRNKKFAGVALYFIKEKLKRL